mmetsp:Transcript_32317/g.50547  ORF Transcript_32317/g.50547 Transcript_32317/m.50547 type:complete len:378 (-) Transcript_32317:69-1202(-)
MSIQGSDPPLASSLSSTFPFSSFSLDSETKKHGLGIVFGQIISLFITGTGIFSTLLADNYDVNLPVAQSFLVYFFLSFTGLYLHFGRNEFISSLKERGKIYFFLAFIDVEANFLVVKAYQYTSITSVMLLDCFTIPATMFLSFFLLSASYNLLQIWGVVVCVIGLVVLVIADYRLAEEEGEYEGTEDAGGDGWRAVLGDGLVLMGSVCYAISNVGQEKMVKKYNRIEYLCFLGLFGSIISGIQMAALEHKELAEVDWCWGMIGCIIGFCVCMLCMYTLVNSMLLVSTAVVLNLSLLTSDFYAAIVAVFLFDQMFSWLYVVGFACTILGIIFYHLPFDAPTPSFCKRKGMKEEEEVDEEQGEEDYDFTNEESCLLPKS